MTSFSSLPYFTRCSHSQKYSCILHLKLVRLFWQLCIIKHQTSITYTEIHNPHWPHLQFCRHPAEAGGGACRWGAREAGWRPEPPAVWCLRHYRLCGWSSSPWTRSSVKGGKLLFIMQRGCVHLSKNLLLFIRLLNRFKSSKAEEDWIIIHSSGIFFGVTKYKTFNILIQCKSVLTHADLLQIQNTLAEV